MFYLIIFVFGISVGSFLNCLIYRLRTEESFLKGRSFCPKCHHKLGFFDLIPILSFVILRGKCRYCGKKISWQYPVVETATGLLFLLTYISFFPDSIFKITAMAVILQMYYFLIVSFLIVIFVYDLKHYIIPDKVIYSAIGITLLFRILDFGHWDLFGIWDLGFGILKGLTMPMIAGISAGAFFFLLWLVSRGRWMGLGDVKLAFFMGLFLGYPNILPALFSAFLIGAIIGLVLIMLGKKTLKSQVPFGPFLVTGTFIALFLGDKIINWYLSLL